MEISKKEIEKLVSCKIKDYKVEKVYEGDKVVRLNILAVPVADPREITITIKPART